MLLPFYGIVIGFLYLILAQTTWSPGLFLVFELQPLVMGVIAFWAHRAQKITPLLRELFWIFFGIWTMALLGMLIPLGGEWLILSSLFLIAILILTLSPYGRNISIADSRNVLCGVIAGLAAGKIGHFALPMLWFMPHPFSLLSPLVFYSLYGVLGFVLFLSIWKAKMRATAWGFALGLLASVASVWLFSWLMRAAS